MTTLITDSHTVSLPKTDTEPAPPSKKLTVEDVLAAAKAQQAKTAVTPIVTPVTPPAPATLTMQEKLEKLITVKVLDNTSSHFTHEGICKKCGFHSMQLSDAAAREILRGHVQQHWRDVANQA